MHTLGISAGHDTAACRPVDAIRCFSSNGLDALAVGSFLLEKSPPRSAS